MIAKTLQNVALQGRTLPNRVLIPVPWDEADRLCSRLRDRGIEATACFDVADRSAGIELPPGVDSEAVQHILDEQLRGKALPK